MSGRRLSMLAMAMAIALSSCASVPPSDHGSFVITSGDTNKYLASDVSTQLGEVFPPASTSLDLASGDDDALGQAIATALRGKGYAVKVSTAPDARSRATRMQYVFDTVSDGFFRLTLSVGPAAVSRAYVSEGGVLVPAGDWTRKE
jgi:hypothetical protein